jgi:membrane associated rhomboid family serine protease
MFPLYDDNPHILTPVVTVGIIALNAAVWVFAQGLGSEPHLIRSVCELGLIPGDLLGRLPVGERIELAPGAVCVIGQGSTFATPFTSMFLHGGWFHLIGNMWFLWIFGNNIEDSMGHARFAVFYTLCGLAAAALQVAARPDSGIPLVGASGAIGGVMGAYIVLFPRVHVHTLVVLGFWVTRIAVPAIVMLGYWFALQLLGGAVSLGREGGGVAFWAHVGGFAAGVLLILPFRNPRLVGRHLHARMGRRRR